MANSIFHHEEIYRGKDLVKKLSKFQITICGCGAIGSNLADNLARQGFSKIRVIDMDRVDAHNINTQAFETQNIGALKTSSIQNRIFRTTGTEIEIVSKELVSNNIKKLLKGSDLVVDGFDNSKSRRLVTDYCLKEKIPCIHGGLEATYGEVIWNESYKVPQDTDGDVCDYPLARNLIMIVVAMLSEEIIDFCLNENPRKHNWCVTLKDLKISRL